ncbi:hypothetical protein AB1Y20_023148 [Prymnesium parvum]|uniref:Fatty acyl-CoA reductase n=1 Tax=Prymnesium parvum TaxID=97485 RepID=A0AB34JFW6_PRYPA
MFALLLLSARGLVGIATPQPSTILATGVTGMLGSQVVKDLLNTDPSIRVACIVRADSDEHAQSRVEAALGGSDFSSRVTGFCGDVTQPGLGLSIKTQELLQNEVDAIVHIAADIRLAKGDGTAVTNLAACDDVMAFASSCCKRPMVHFTSSIASCVKYGERIAPEDMRYEKHHAFGGGYGEQKWEAEQRFHKWSLSTGGPVTIYRMPFLISPTFAQRMAVPTLVFQMGKLIGKVPDHDQVDQMRDAGLLVSSVPFEEFEYVVRKRVASDRSLRRLQLFLPVVEAVASGDMAFLDTLQADKAVRAQGITLDELNIDRASFSKVIDTATATLGV